MYINKFFLLIRYNGLFGKLFDFFDIYHRYDLFLQCDIQK